MKFFQITDLLPSFGQDFLNILQGNAGFYHHNQKMIDQVADFIGRILIFAVFDASFEISSSLGTPSSSDEAKNTTSPPPINFFGPPSIDMDALRTLCITSLIIYLLSSNHVICVQVL